MAFRNDFRTIDFFLNYESIWQQATIAWCVIVSFSFIFP